MTLSSTTIALELLGGAKLIRSEREPWRLERKTAGALAYLALEGATSRTTLAGLLWPESPESTARNNLRQMLRRSRDAAGAELIAGDDPLALASEVSVDAAQLELEAFAGRDAAVIEREGELLGGYEFDDCQEFMDWLLVQRERIYGLRREARARLIEASERAGDYRAALVHAERLLETDPVSESAHRRVMRLHYLLGDRGAALSAFERCRAVLMHELNVAPMPETLALATQIEGGARVTESAPPTRREIPLSVQRPPVLVGRGAVWAKLESAWDAGLGISVSGEPGVGKTRLVQEFVGTKGEYAVIEGRPGDESLPYSTFARSLRNTLGRHPELRLEPWASRELSRLVPSLHADAPPPITSDAERLRFFEAMASAIERLIGGGLRSIVIDDLQYMDAASFEAAQYLAARFSKPESGRVVCISIYRSGELRPEFEAIVHQSIQAGVAAPIEVERLEPEALKALLESLSLRHAPELAASLERHTGGNPLFALETLRSLIESGDLERGLPARLPVPDRLGLLVARRLERLSLAAQRLARSVAVAGADFDLELGARVLETPILDLAEPWAELEAAQVMRAANFAHDLLAEAALASVPAPIRALLHRRTAEYLEGADAQPARIAAHWLGASDPARAAPFLMEAARRAHATFELRAEADLLELAGRNFELLNRPREAFAAFEQGFAALCRVDTAERCEALVEHLMRLAGTPEETAAAWTRRAERLHLRGEGTQAEAAARQALEYARLAQHERLSFRAQSALIHAIYVQGGRTDDLIALSHESRIMAERLEDKEALAGLESDLGVLVERKDEFHKALEHDRRALVLFENLHSDGKLADPQARVHVRLNLAAGLSSIGHHEEALWLIREAETLHAEIGEDTDVAIHMVVNASAMLHQLGRYTEALDSLGTLKRLLETYQSWVRPYLLQRQFEIYPDLGIIDRAQPAIDELLALPNLRAGSRVHALIAQSRINPASRALEPILEAEALLQTVSRPLALFRLFLVKSPLLEPEEGLRLAERCLEAFSSRGSDGGVMAARLRCAQAHLALGQPERALEPSALAVEALPGVTPELAYRGNVLLVRYRVLSALGDPAARTALERALEWVLSTADHHVPAEFRESFLNRNPVNRQMLEAAADLGIGLG